MEEPLASLLARLKSEIEQGEHGDLDRDELARLAGDVERRLEADHDAEHHDDSLGDDLREGVGRFEASHPDLAAGIRRAADALGGLGL